MNEPAINFKNLWKPFLIAAALAFLFANVLIGLGFDWWTDENYSHGLLVPFVIGFIVWAQWDELKNAVTKPRPRSGAVVVGFGLLLLSGGTLGAELFTRRIALVVVLTGIIIYFFGAKILPLLVTPFLLLLFAIPIPQIIFNKIAFPLQIYASRMAVWGIRLFDVPTVRNGNVFEILPFGATQTIALEVVEACSGIRSLMTLVTLALVLAYFTRDRDADDGWLGLVKSFDFWRALILMLSAIPIAVVTNAARVTATGILAYYYGMRALGETIHDLTGWLVYLVALALMILLNVLLKSVFRRFAAPPNRKTAEKTDAENPRVFSFGKPANVWLILLLLAGGGVLINWFENRGEAVVERQSLAEMPRVLGDWRQKGDAIRFSAASEAVLRADDYTMREYALPDGKQANLYVGYYRSQRIGATYHSPQNCLPGAGWTMTDPAIIEIETPSGKTFSANRYQVSNGDADEIMIYWYQGRGRAEASEYADKINTIKDSVLRRRSDGAMVRVMIPAGADEAAATRAAIDLAARTADRLDAFVPE